MSGNYEIIKQAILSRSAISATYQGYQREMNPHVIGVKNGKQQALFYQFGGYSSSGAIVPNSKSNWRCMPIDQLTNVQITNKGWHTAENHSSTQTCVDIIDVEVSY
ncbi:hypothetical protein KZX29_00865 [Moraxella osloensis]|uniref:hypothetical protein n=1 Tax=Faucicola osloensis TaxID=34062 RepID=UPI0020064A24|nr:hypothetical protein [Moraxella osloensis]MCK6157354.1 hypothetical protein [Moraxella osloensis]